MATLLNENTQIIPDHWHGKRLDLALVECFPDYSRSRIQRWLREEKILVDGVPATAKTKVAGGESVTISRLPVEENEACIAQPIPLDIIFEDEHLLVINKPANLVMHPAPGNRDGTVQNGLLYYLPALAEIPRAGIVHRLDKDTTGLFVVAKTHLAHKSLVDQLQTRSMSRGYESVVMGHMVAGGQVDQPIGRHRVDRKRMAVVDNGRPAVTHYRVSEKFTNHTHVSLNLETGRTHQIRVHMAYIRHPLIGDPVYGTRLRIPADCNEGLQQNLRAFNRQALHAARLKLEHPESQALVSWESPIPEDMKSLLAALKNNEPG